MLFRSRRLKIRTMLCRHLNKVCVAHAKGGLVDKGPDDDKNRSEQMDISSRRKALFKFVTCRPCIMFASPHHTMDAASFLAREGKVDAGLSRSQQIRLITYQTRRNTMTVWRRTAEKRRYCIAPAYFNSCRKQPVTRSLVRRKKPTRASIFTQRIDDVPPRYNNGQALIMT